MQALIIPVRGASCQRVAPGSGPWSVSAASPDIGLLSASGVCKGSEVIDGSIQPDVLKLSAIIVVKIRQIVVGEIKAVFQTENLLKKYCVFILL